MDASVRERLGRCALRWIRNTYHNLTPTQASAQQQLAQVQNLPVTSQNRSFQIKQGLCFFLLGLSFNRLSYACNPSTIARKKKMIVHQSCTVPTILHLQCFAEFASDSTESNSFVHTAVITITMVWLLCVWYSNWIKLWKVSNKLINEFVIPWVHKHSNFQVLITDVEICIYDSCIFHVISLSAMSLIVYVVITAEYHYLDQWRIREQLTIRMGCKICMYEYCDATPHVSIRVTVLSHMRTDCTAHIQHIYIYIVAVINFT